MSHCRIDHITITSPSLQAGSDFVFERLGARPGPGGEHPRMGTHNLLLRLGETMFLEVIAANPKAEKPSRPRWFALDELPQGAGPRLACWVARSEDIHASAISATEALGDIEPMSRGGLEWLISIPGDGSLALGGAAPALVQWSVAVHPAVTMQDLGCSLVALDVLHPSTQRVSALLRSLSLDEPSVQVSVLESPVPGLVAHIRTPSGLRTIGASNPASGLFARE